MEDDPNYAASRALMALVERAGGAVRISKEEMASTKPVVMIPLPEGYTLIQTYDTEEEARAACRRWREENLAASADAADGDDLDGPDLSTGQMG